MTNLTFKEELERSEKERKTGKKYIIDTYNPHRIFCFYCHKQENKLVEVYNNEKA